MDCLTVRLRPSLSAGGCRDRHSVGHSAPACNQRATLTVQVAGEGAMRWADVHKPTWRIVTLPGAAVVSGSLMITGCGSAHATVGRSVGAVHGQPVPASAIPRLRVIADRAAKVNGAVPSWISAVVTTYPKALASATPGDIVPSARHQTVYLLTMKGQFRSPWLPRPCPGTGHMRRQASTCPWWSTRRPSRPPTRA